MVNSHANFFFFSLCGYELGWARSVTVASRTQIGPSCCTRCRHSQAASLAIKCASIQRHVGKPLVVPTPNPHIHVLLLCSLQSDSPLHGVALPATQGNGPCCVGHIHTCDGCCVPSVSTRLWRGLLWFKLPLNATSPAPHASLLYTVTLSRWENHNLSVLSLAIC